MQNRTFPEQAEKLMSSWWFGYWTWGAIHYTLGLIASVGAVLSVTKSSPFDPLTQTYVVVVAAVCTAVITFAKTDAKMNAFIAAWRLLNVVRVKYGIYDSISAKDIGDTISKCEEIIGRSD